MTEWFADWFGETYLQLYPHRDEDDARRVLALIARVIELRNVRVLDLACGEGRHTIQLSELGARPVGIDLSDVLVRRARRNWTPAPLVLRGDMRVLPFRPGSFDVVVNLFTSFGYFATDEEHQNILTAVSGLLVPRGWFVLDFLNADQVKTDLVPREQKQLGDEIVEIERRLVDDGAFVEKIMRVGADGNRHVERVRLFSAENLREMMHVAGFDVVHEYGDYDGGPITPDSPRVVFLTRKQ